MSHEPHGECTGQAGCNDYEDRPLDFLLAEMRESGWLVAAHNDYMLGGKFQTFWLFTHKETGRYVKGEDQNDRFAVIECLRARDEMS